MQVAWGNITSVSNPRLDSVMAAQPKYANSKCSACQGKGFSVSTTTKYEQLTPNVYQASSTGYASLVRAGQSLKIIQSSQTKCKVCEGSGVVSRQVKKQ